MKNSKLTQVLKTFNKIDFNQFGKFVSSPYYSGGRNLVPLYKAIKKFYPDFAGDGFSRENILRELALSGYKASNGFLKTQMSVMYKLAEKFLTLQSGMNETGLNAYYFAKNCRNRGLYRLGESKISESINKIEKKGIDGSFYQNYYFGKVEMINFFFMRDKPLKGVQTLNHMSEILVHNFLCNASRYVYNMSALKRGLNVDTQNNLLYSFINIISYEELLKYLQSRDDSYSNASSIYILFMLMFLKPDEDVYYFRFKDELFKKISIFSFYDQSFFLQGINFKAADMIMGLNYEVFAKETFEIINFRLNNNLYKQNPDAPYTSNEFHSAFYIGFILKEKDWLQNFTKRYLNEVLPEQRDSCYDMGKPFIEFLEHDYISCLKSINHLKSVAVPHSFVIKRLQLMAFYEAGYIDQAFYALDAFRSFLRQNKNISAEFMQGNINFIKYYTRLLRHKHKEEEIDLKKTRTEVCNSDIGNQEWIIEKIDELAPLNPPERGN